MFYQRQQDITVSFFLFEIHFKSRFDTVSSVLSLKLYTFPRQKSVILGSSQGLKHICHHAYK